MSPLSKAEKAVSIAAAIGIPFFVWPYAQQGDKLSIALLILAPIWLLSEFAPRGARIAVKAVALVATLALIHYSKVAAVIALGIGLSMMLERHEKNGKDI